MSTRMIAVAGAALLLTGMALPASAVLPGAGSVRNLKVTKVGKGCVRVKWDPPRKSTRETYGVVIHTRRGEEMYRIETYKTHAKMCDLNAKTYHVQVKQYGSGWARGAVRLG